MVLQVCSCHSKIKQRTQKIECNPRKKSTSRDKFITDYPDGNPFLPNAPILYPLKTPENLFSGFLVFSGGIKWEHWPEMG